MSNTVVLSAFVSCKARLVFLDVIFSIWIFFSKVIQKSDCYWVLEQVCTAPTLSKSEKILMSLNSKQKPLCQLATAELFPTRQENIKKWQKHVWVWCFRLAVPSLCNHAKPYLMVTNCSSERSFTRFKRKNELKGRNVPGEVVHTKHSVH